MSCQYRGSLRQSCMQYSGLVAHTLQAAGPEYYRIRRLLLAEYLTPSRGGGGGLRENYFKFHKIKNVYQKDVESYVLLFWGPLYLLGVGVICWGEEPLFRGVSLRH
jgi:hypothetical protein